MALEVWVRMETMAMTALTAAMVPKGTTATMVRTERTVWQELPVRMPRMARTARTAVPVATVATVAMVPLAEPVEPVEVPPPVALAVSVAMVALAERAV